MLKLIHITALLCFVTIANAFPPGNAWELPFAKGDYRKAHALAAPSAEKGNIEAQYFIGYMYLNGPGGKKDYEKAYPYFKKAAKAGNPEAINYFGLYYLKGYGSIKKDIPRGIFCIATAAQKGSANARENLINAISGNDGSKVLKYLESEADKGNIVAICELGNYYHNELSPESNDDKMKNQDKAEEYYRRILRYRPEDPSIPQKLDAIFWAVNQSLIASIVFGIIATIAGLILIWVLKILISRYIFTQSQE